MADQLVASPLVTIDGQQYNALMIPDATSKLVAEKKALVLGEMQLDDLLRNLDTVGQLLFVAYNGVATITNLRGNVALLHTDYMRLCARSQHAMAEFEICCKKVLAHLTNVFNYLLKADEETAVMYLGFMAETATAMATVASALAKEFEKITADAQTAHKNAEDAKLVEEKEKQKLDDERKALEAKTLEQQQLLKGIDALKAKLQKLYDNAKEAAEKHESRAFGLAITSAIMGTIGQGLGTFGAVYMSSRQLPPILPTTPPAKDAKDATPKPAAKPAPADTPELKDAKADVEKTKAAAEVAGNKVDQAITATNAAKTAAAAARKNAEEADANAKNETDPAAAAPLRQVAQVKKETADKKDAELTIAEQQQRVAEADKKTADATAKEAEGKYQRLVAALASGAGAALQQGGAAVDEMGKSYAQIATEYNKERRELLNQMLRQDELEREALAKIAKFGLQMQNLGSNIQIAALVVDALHQAIGALKQIVVILEKATTLWTNMATRCKEMQDDSGKLKQNIDLWRKRDKDERIKLYMGEPFLVQIVSYYAGWKGLQVISSEYSAAAGKIKVKVENNVKSNLSTTEMLKLAVTEGKKLELAAQTDIAALDKGTDAIRQALAIKDPVPAAPAHA